MHVARLSFALITVIVAGENLQAMADEIRVDAPTFNPPYLKDYKVGDFGPSPTDVFGKKLSAPLLAPANGFAVGKLLHKNSALAGNLESNVRGEIVDMAVSTKHPRDVEFGPYMAKLQCSIKRCWFPPKDDESKRTVVVFKVNRKGKLSNLRIVESSGSKKHDQAGLEAVKKAAPFDPLPEGDEKSVDISFTFDCNVYSGGGKGEFRKF